jgi:hypothetical protein
MPADPNSPAPERDPYEADESDAEELAADAYDLGALKKRADVAGLLALAKAYRSGSAPTGRDLNKCLDAYRAAAELGNAEAEYAVALFLMNGGTVVAQDLKEGTMRLRSAAEKGSVPAKVYLGNLYELGIHYKADAEKADVWYRNAARTAHVEAEQGSEAWNRALADLGCARQVLALTREPAADEEEKKRLLARAKAHGLGLRIREGAASDGDRATFVDALAGAEAAATATPPPVAVDLPSAPSARERKDTSPETKQAKQKVEAKSLPPPPKPVDPAVKAAADKAAKKRSAERKVRLAGALGAFGYALLFMIAGVGAGYAATLGASELVGHGHVLPLVGTRTRLVFPIVLAAIGVLPAWLVYRFGAVLKALVMGGVVGGLGWVAWGTGSGAFHGDRPLQALAFGVGGFLAGLLVLGLLGGTKQARVVPRPR